MTARTAAAIIIGNEILSGKFADANGPYLIRALRERGVELRHVAVVPDEDEAIVEAVRRLMPLVDVLFTSGGLGPTHDDVTVRAVAAALSRPIVRDARMEARVRDAYGHEVNPDALRLADAPEGARFVDAPGLWIPVLTVENLVLLPGVPELFRAQLDAVVDRYRSEAFVLRRVFLSVHEHLIASGLTAVAGRFPDLSIGSYPVLEGEHRVLITLEGRSTERVQEALAALLGALPSHAVLRVE
jgi:molybdenum cofactor synthesis domain-containing protein